MHDVRNRQGEKNATAKGSNYIQSQTRNANNVKEIIVLVNLAALKCYEQSERR